MISASDEHQRASDRALLAWSFLLSGPVTVLLWMLLFLRLPLLVDIVKAPQQAPEMLTSTSIVRLERTIPEPQNLPNQPRVPSLPKPQGEPAAAQEAQPTPEAAPADLARQKAKAPPQPPPAKTRSRAASLSEILAQQNAAFQRETQEINANRAPLSVATVDPNNRPQSSRTYAMDYSGLPRVTGHGQGVITSLRVWLDHGLDCYYGHYTYQYPDGGTEEGNIPWSFCYSPRADPLRYGGRHLAMPTPLPGYRLPAGVQLQPQEQQAYDDWLSQQPKP